MSSWLETFISWDMRMMCVWYVTMQKNTGSKPCSEGGLVHLMHNRFSFIQIFLSSDKCGIKSTHILCWIPLLDPALYLGWNSCDADSILTDLQIYILWSITWNCTTLPVFIPQRKGVDLTPDLFWSVRSGYTSSEPLLPSICILFESHWPWCRSVGSWSWCRLVGF